MQRDAATQFIDVAAGTLSLLEAQRILNIVIEEGTKQVERIEVEFFEGKRHRNVATLVKFSGREDDSTGVSLHHIACVAINKVAILVDRAAFLVI